MTIVNVPKYGSGIIVTIEPLSLVHQQGKSVGFQGINGC